MSGEAASPWAVFRDPEQNMAPRVGIEPRREA